MVGESASLGRWRHVAERGGGAEASALGVERMTTVALPLDLFIVEFLLSMNDIRAFVQETVFLQNDSAEGYGSFLDAYAARQGFAE